MILLLYHFPPSGNLRARALALLLHLAPLNAPVEDVVVLVTLTDEEVAEQLAKVRIVGLVVEAKGTGVVQKDAKLVGEAATEEVSGGRHLLLHDAVVLLLLGRGLEALPGKRTAEEVHKDVGEGLQVITTGLLDTQMRIDGGVASSTSQILVLPVWNVEMGLGVPVLLRKTKIDNVDLVSTLANAHKEVVGLDVTMDEVARVDVFYTRDLHTTLAAAEKTNRGIYQLVGQEQDSLESEFAIAEVEEVLEGRSEEIDDHRIVVTFGTEPTDERNTNAACEGLVDLGFVFQLGMLGLNGLQLDGYFFTGNNVDTEVNVACGDGVRLTDAKWCICVTHQKSLSLSFSPDGTCLQLASPAFRAQTGPTS